MLFQLSDVSLARGGRLVLDGVTLDVERGATAVVGPSGAGKSTLLRLLNRLVDPDRGTVLYRGRDLREHDVLDLRRAVTLVPQLPALLDASVSENVALGPSLAGRAADVERCLGLAGLDRSFGDREARRLSVGEQQRVMLARALALDPEVLLLDEPTAALDQETRDAIEHTLVELRERVAVSLVLVTHDLGQARRLGDRLVWLADGRLAEQPAQAGAQA